MAKDNLFLGMARGKVGDVVFSRLNGVQVSRARNRAPHNPQSPAQMVQRIIMSSVGKAYSFMQAICNHSFEGFETGQLSQRKFMEVNVGLLRDKCAEVLEYPVEEVIKASGAFNFSFKNDYSPVMNQYMISAGSLPSLPIVHYNSGYYPCLSFDPGELTATTITYADMVSLLGVQQGDQLTFVQVTHDSAATGHDTDILTGFRYARVILEPSDGDMTSPFLQSGHINKPNERNEGSFSQLTISTAEDIKGLVFMLSNVVQSTAEQTSDKELAASAVILSRQIGGRWLRSTQFLLPRFTSSAKFLNHSTLALAYETYKLGVSSDLYLNQAT